METVHPIQVRREAKGLTQSALADLVCDFIENETGDRPQLTAQGISRLENRVTIWPGKDVRDALRHILGAATNEELEMRPTRPRRRPRPQDRSAPQATAAAVSQQEVPPVRRRDFLASAAALGIEGVMFGPTGATAPAPRLRAQLAAAQGLYRDTEYAELGKVMPDLIDRAIGLGEPRLLAQAYMLATELMIKNGKDTSAVFTAAEARKAAEQSGDPLCRAEAAWMTCVMLRHAGQSRAGFDLIESAASELEATGLGSPTALATFGHMMLTTAYTAAAAGYAPEARWFYAEGLRIAGRFPQEVTHGLWFFGPAQAAGYGISVANNLGDPGAALKAAASLNPDSLPSRERMERYWCDLTQALLAAGRPEQACEALRSLCLIAPLSARRARVQDLAQAAGMGQKGLKRAAAAGRKALLSA
jgi:transcriptional regulator with XRE-family HTH domain